MNGRDAFEEEMSDDLAKFLETMREKLPEHPGPAFEADLVSRMAATARAEHVTATLAPARRPARVVAGVRRLALPARIALATVGLVLGTAGLAVAGVSLPAPVDSAFKGVGIDLPNQGPSKQDEPATAPGEARPAPGDGSGGSTDGRQPGSQPKHESHGKGQSGQGSASPGNSANAPGGAKAHGRRATPPSQSKSKAKAHPPTPQVPPVEPGGGSNGKQK